MNLLCVLFCLIITTETVYTVSQKYSVIFDNNFGKCGPIFKILSPSDSQENSLCIHYKYFLLVCSVFIIIIILLHYLLKFEN